MFLSITHAYVFTRKILFFSVHHKGLDKREFHMLSLVKRLANRFTNDKGIFGLLKIVQYCTVEKGDKFL